MEVIHTSNKGVSASRNLGLSHATGELVTFLDGDDWLKPDTLSRLHEDMLEHAADMVGCNFESVWPDGTDKAGAGKTSAAAAATGDTASSDAAETLESMDFITGHLLKGDMHVWGRLFKRSLIGEQRFMRGLTIGEDMLFVLEYVRKCGTIRHLSYEGYNYYRNPAGAMSRPFSDAAMDQVRCWDEAAKALADISTDLDKCPALRAQMLISVMLTASRMAGLDREERRDGKHREYTDLLKSRIKEYKNRSAMKLLDRGYRLKVRLFAASPALYMSLYHMHRS